MRVRADILRTYQGVHTWTGIITGLVLFIGFYAAGVIGFLVVLSLLFIAYFLDKHKQRQIG